MGRTKPIVSSDYIVGITDGEGCFYVLVCKSSRYRAGWRVQLHFHLKLQESDRELLWKIRNTLDCGNIYFQKEKRVNHTHCYRYTVNATRDVIGKIIPFFKKHPLQTVSKRKSFKIFCQIADLMEKGKHNSSKNINKIRVLKSHMNKRTIGLA